jgi:hypothetical protein
MPWDPRHSRWSAKQKMLLGDIVELPFVCARQLILVVYLPLSVAKI